MSSSIILLLIATSATLANGEPSSAFPTFRFTYSPPAGWTYFTTPGPGQSSSQDNAKQLIRRDIEAAVHKSVEAYGMPQIIVDLNTDGVPPTFADPSSAPATLTHSFRVTAVAPLEQSRWEAIANKVWAQLTGSANVVFHGFIQVDV